MVFFENSNWLIFCLILLIAVGFYVQRIDSRVRLIKMRMDRLSLTFLKIENDLSAIQDSLLILSRSQGGDIADSIAKIRDRRPQILRHIVELGPNTSEILRGLEFPDIDEDPAFWADDRMKRFGLVDSDDTKEQP